MSSLAEVLAWKYDTAPGIRTRENAKGNMVIFDWPKVLGAKPTLAQIAAWTEEYDALPPAPDPNDELAASLQSLKDTDATVDQLIDALLGNVGRKGRIAGRTV